MKMENRNKYRNLSKQYKCENCGTEFIAPMHCGHPMHINELDGHKEWNCWMGAGCGKNSFNAKCDSPTLVPF